MTRYPAALSFAFLSVFALAPLALAQPAPVPVPPILFPVAQGAQWEDTFGAPRSGHTHIGQDLMAPKMRPLIACFAGTVTLHSDHGTAGNWVTLQGTGDALGWRAEYMHLNNDTPGTNDNLGGDRYAFAPGLKTGDTVLAGQLIGYVGDSGNAESAGSHCHFELHGPGGPVNCALLLRAARVLFGPQAMQTQNGTVAAPSVAAASPVTAATLSLLVGNVLAVFPEQGEVMVRVTSVTSQSGKPAPLDPPVVKRLVIRDKDAFATLAKDVLLTAEGEDEGTGKPLQVQRLTTLDTDPISATGSGAAVIPAQAPGAPAFILLPDGTRVEGRELVTMEATNYGPGQNGKWGDKTALGTKVGYGTVAVDPKVIPLRTHLWVEGYGFCIALDTGSSIKGMKIDLGHNSDSEAAVPGQKKRRVLILD